MMKRRSIGAALLGLIAATVLLPPAQAADPIRIGLGMAQTGPLAANGKSALLAMDIWRDDINAKGGLLGRPVEIVVYDDQSNPSTVPGIYTKLLEVMPTSIHSSSEKGMRTHHPSVSRSRRDTPSVGHLQPDSAASMSG